MSISWKYKTELKSDKVFSKIQKEYNLEIPEEIKELISEANGATPDKLKIMIGDTERVFGSVLSFNEGDPDDVYTALESMDYKNLLPFAVDPFGNYFCYHVKKHVVYFWDHEENRMENSGYDLGDFLDALY